jgi:hypothetical protein
MANISEEPEVEDKGSLDISPHLLSFSKLRNE